MNLRFPALISLWGGLLIAGLLMGGCGQDEGDPLPAAEPTSIGIPPAGTAPGTAPAPRATNFPSPDELLRQRPGSTTR